MGQFRPLKPVCMKRSIRSFPLISDSRRRPMRKSDVRNAVADRGLNGAINLKEEANSDKETLFLISLQ